MRLGEAPVTRPDQTPQYYDEFSFLTFERTLAANQELIDQTIAVEADSDFVWVALVGESTGAFEIRFKLPSGRYNSSSRIRNSMCVGTAQLPAPVVPFVFAPANGRIGVDIKDLSAAGNSVYLALRGYRRFRRK